MNKEESYKPYSAKRWHGQLSDLETIEHGHPTKEQKARMEEFRKGCRELIEKRKREGKP